jgi:predicted ATPase
VLDNCEHLIDNCAALVDNLLRECDNLQVLATSREGLRVGREQLYRVRGLPVPDPAALPSLEELDQVAAVRLLLERAVEQQAGFETRRNGPSTNS